MSQPEAPESVKYHGGYDPADPPLGEDDDTPFSETCVVCDKPCNPDESVYDEAAKTWTCCNCAPADSELLSPLEFSEPGVAPQEAHEANALGSGTLSLAPEPFGINEVLADFRRRYGPSLP